MRGFKFFIINILLAIVCLGSGGFSQAVRFDEKPSHYQLYPRSEFDNDSAIVQISGTVLSSGYQSIVVEIDSNNVFWRQHSQPLVYDLNNSASFNLTPKIRADLANYRFKIKIRSNNGSITTLETIEKVVCGDVFLIQGQSNAEADVYDSWDEYQVEWVRSFGRTADTDEDRADEVAADTTWDLAQAEEVEAHAAVGIWGLRLGKLISETYGIPVCILNGSPGGSRILTHHMFNEANREDLETVYGRLLWRAKKAGVANNVKALIWWQGESNASSTRSNRYRVYFPILRDEGWRVDFPGLKKIYTAQIHPGYGSYCDNIREYQRFFAETDSNTYIMTPFDLGGLIDGDLHFSPWGYEGFADRVFKQISRDFYNDLDVIDIDPPNIKQAFFTSPEKDVLVLEFENTTSLFWQNDTIIDGDRHFLKDYFYFNDDTAIDTATVFGNFLRLILDTTSTAGEITYLPPEDYNGTNDIYEGPWLKSARGIPATSFLDFPINGQLGEDPDGRFVLATNTVGSGNIFLNPPGGLYSPDTTVILTAVPESGFQFSGWSGDFNGTQNPISVTMNSHKSITALFTEIPPDPLQLTINTTGSGNVILNPPGGSYQEGTAVTLTAIPGSGFEFDRWSGDVSSSNNPITIVMNSDKTVNAIFEEIFVPQFTLNTTIIGAGNVILDPPGGLYQEGTPVTLTAEPVVNFDFNGWSGDLSGFQNPVTITMNSDKNVSAIFTTQVSGGPVVHQETKTGAASAASTVSTSEAIAGVSNHLYLAVISSKSREDVLSVSGLGLDWAFVKSQCSGRNQTGVEIWMALGTPNGSGTVTANFDGSPGNSVIAVSRYAGVDSSTPLGMTVAGNTNGVDGECSGGIDNDSYSFDIPAFVDGALIFGAAALRNRRHEPGSDFNEIIEITQGDGGSACGLAVQEKGISAAGLMAIEGSLSRDVDWAAIGIEIRPEPDETVQYSLSITTAGSGSVVADPSGGIYDEGTIVSLSAVPAIGYQFSGWSGDLIGNSNPATLTMDSNKAVTATFTELPQEQFTLTVNINGFGNAVLDPPGGVYAAGTAVSILAGPSEGYEFSGWSGDLSGMENPQTIVINADKSVTANFTEPNLPAYTLTATPVGSGSISLNPPGGIYQSGTVVTLAASPQPGFQFDGWSGDLSGNDNPAAITIDGDKMVIAAFSELPSSGGGGPVVFEEIQSGGASESAEVSTTEPLSGVSGDLYLAAITTKNRRDVVSVEGLGLSWSLLSSRCSGRDQTGVEVWMAIGNPSANGIVTATFTSATQNAVIAVSRYSGVDPSAPLGMTISGNSNGIDGACSGGTDSDSYAFDFTTTSEGAVVYGAIAMRNRRHEPGVEYTEHVEFKQDGGLGGSTATMAIQDREVASPATMAFEGSFNRQVDWAIIAMEIRPGGSGGGGSNQYSLSTNTIGSGSISLNPSGGIYDESTTVTLTAIPDAGYQFSGWNGDLIGETNPSVITMDDDKTVTATFSELPTEQFSLTVNINGSGTVVLNPPGGVYTAETVVSILAVPSGGYEFSGWSGDASGLENPLTLVMDANKTVIADFNEPNLPAYTLTATSIGSGSISLTPPGGIYQAGTVVTLAASPQPGFQFDGWSGDLSGNDNPAAITIDGDKMVIAAFSELPSSGGGGPVVFEEIQSGGSSESAQVSTAEPISGVSGDLYVAAISTKNRRDVVSVEGLGLSWSLLNARCSGRDQTGVEVWMAIGNPSANGIVTATFTSATQNAVIAVSRYSGVDPSAPLGMTISGNSNGIDGACSGGTDNDSYAFDFTTTSEGAVVYGAIAMRNRRHEPGAGYTEHVEFKQDGGLGGSTATMAVQDREVATPATMAFEGSFNRKVDWAIIAMEIRPGGSGGGGSTQYSLSTTTIGSGSISLSPPGGVYDEGTSVTLTALPAAGYQFSGWSGDLSGNSNPSTITMDGDKTVTATFSELPPEQFTLTVNINGSGSVVLNPPGGVYDAGTPVTILAIPSQGYEFSGWSGDLSGMENPQTIVIDADKSVTANFVEQNLPTVSLATLTFGSGNILLDPAPLESANGNRYFLGTEVTLTALPEIGYQFSGWGGHINGFNNPVPITMDSDQNVVAVFSDLPQVFVTLTINLEGAGSVTLDPPPVTPAGSGGEYQIGTVVTITAIPDPNYQFSGWNGDLNGTRNPQTIIINENKSVTASFVEQSSSNGPVVYEETIIGGATEAAVVTTAGNIIAVNGDLYLAAIVTKNRTDVIDVEGLGLAWNRLKAQCSGRSMTGVEVWVAIGNPTMDGTVSATLASSPSNSLIAVTRYSGVDSSMPLGMAVGGNTNGLDGDCSGGTDSDGYTFDFTTTTDGAVIYGAIALRNRRHTPGADYTERGEFVQDGALGGDKATLAIQDRLVDTPATVAFDGIFNKTVDWAAIGIEIRPGGSTSKLAFRPGGKIRNGGKEVAETSDEIPQSEKPEIINISENSLTNYQAASLPETLILGKNYPEPFNPSTTIEYGLPNDAHVKLRIYNILGQQMRTLINSRQSAGFKTVVWDGRDQYGNRVASGIYFVQLKVGKQRLVRKVTLRK